MSKKQEVKTVKENNSDVEVAAIPKTYRSVSVSSSGATESTSDTLTVQGGIAKVSARNTGSNVLRVKIVQRAFLTFVVKQWDVARGSSLNTGEFSITVDQYRLRIGPIDGRLPTSGNATLTSVEAAY